MQTILSKEKIDSGSNYNFPDKMEIGHFPSSLFNLSFTKSMTIDNGGLIIPIAWWEYMPRDSFEIKVQHFLRVMPQVVPLFSRERMFIHAFASNYADLQSDFQTLMTKGYSGKVIKKVAPLTSSNLDSELYDSGNGVVTPCSLADYLDLPQGASYSDLIENGVSCLPFLMYESIYKNYYMNKNYYIDNRNWLPDDNESFRVDENGVLASNTDNDHPKVTFGKLHYRDYPYDYFTSALPFAQRGDRPTLNMNFSGDLFKFDEPLVPIGYRIDNSGLTGVGKFGPLTNGGNSGTSVNINYDYSTDGGVHSPTTRIFVLPNSLIGETYPNTVNTNDKAVQDAATRTTQYFNSSLSSGISTTIGLDDIRELARAQVELEKLARTDGSYREFGLSFFGIKPQTSGECRPMWIGGCYSQLSFTEVLQTSESSEGSALGQIAGHGLSVDNNGYIGRFTASDFGMIMIICTIMPDVYYSQGLDKKWTRKFQSEFPLPERMKLGLQPILNKEIFFSGTKSQDDDLFGYQNPFDDYRYFANKICGKIADPNNLSFYPFTQARHFSSLPTLSQSFAIADDIRKDFLFAPSENAYACQFRFQIRGNRPLPYKPIPNNFGF